MNRSDLEKITRQGEGERIEFKLKATHPDKIVKSINAFANTHGGVIIIGVDDNRQILGCKHPEEEEYAMEKALERYCHPIPKFFLERVDIENERQVLVYEIPESSEKPHYFIDPLKPESKFVHIRVGDETFKASREMKNVLKGKTRMKYLKLQYGEKEKKLLEYLEEKGSVTVQEFSELANLSIKIASRTLVFLSVMDLLEIVPSVQGDKFILKNLIEK
jgi:predicted HTH transcriptional regulator